MHLNWFVHIKFASAPYNSTHFKLKLLDESLGFYQKKKKTEKEEEILGKNFILGI